MDDHVIMGSNLAFCPQFSVGRHKPQSRLQDFHTLDYDEELFIDFSYCDKTFPKTIDSNTLGVAFSDFNSILTSRKGSTSTPFRSANQKLINFGACVPSSHEDSGFNESSVLSNFALSCRIDSPVARKPKRPRESECKIHEDFANIPLPCISIEKQLEALCSEKENSNDSEYNVESLEGINLTQTIVDLDETEKFYDERPKPEELEKHASNVSSGYGSMCSSPASFDFSENHVKEGTEQVVPYVEHEVSKTVQVHDVRNHKISKDKANTEEKGISVSACIEKVLAGVAPKEPERVIGRKIGLEKVDIIGELNKRSVITGLTNILKFLCTKDLCAASCVGRRWKESVYNDVASKSRLKNYLKLKESQVEKENSKNCALPARNLTSSTKDGPLGEVQPSVIPVKEIPRIHSTSNYQRFVDAASSLKTGDTLRKCVKCGGPARVDQVQERALCLGAACGHDFCIKCRNIFHGSSECVASVCKKLRSDPVKVGSKKSKQALRRL